MFSKIMTMLQENNKWRIVNSHIHICFSELKDNLGGAPVDGEMSELLRAVLANDPEVFSSGAGIRKSFIGLPQHTSQQSC